MEAVTAWLHDRGLGAYSAAFDNAGYDDLQVLQLLSPSATFEADFIELVSAVGIEKPGHRLKLKTLLAELAVRPLHADVLPIEPSSAAAGPSDRPALLFSPPALPQRNLLGPDTGAREREQPVPRPQSLPLHEACMQGQSHEQLQSDAAVQPAAEATDPTAAAVGEAAGGAFRVVQPAAEAAVAEAPTPMEITGAPIAVKVEPMHVDTAPDNAECAPNAVNAEPMQVDTAPVKAEARALHRLLLLNKLLVQVEGASQESKAEAEPKKQPEKAASDSDSDSDDDTPMCQRMKPAVVPKKPVEVVHHAGTHTALSTTTLSIPAVGHLSVWSTQAIPAAAAAAAAAKAKSDSDSEDDVPLAALTKNTADDNKPERVPEPESQADLPVPLPATTQPPPAFQMKETYSWYGSVLTSTVSCVMDNYGSWKTDAEEEGSKHSLRLFGIFDYTLVECAEAPSDNAASPNLIDSLFRSEAHSNWKWLDVVQLHSLLQQGKLMDDPANSQNKLALLENLLPFCKRIEVTHWERPVQMMHIAAYRTGSTLHCAVYVRQCL